jgi:hypothetical protein
MAYLPNNRQPINFASADCCDCGVDYILKYTDTDRLVFQIIDNDNDSNESFIENGSFVNGDDDWIVQGSGDPNAWTFGGSGTTFYATTPLNASQALLQDIGGLDKYNSECEAYQLCFQVFGLNELIGETLRVELWELADGTGTNQLLTNVTQNGQICINVQFYADVTYLVFYTLNTIDPPTTVNSSLKLTGISMSCLTECAYSDIEIIDTEGNTIQELAPSNVTILNNGYRYTSFDVDLNGFEDPIENGCYRLRLTDCNENELFSNRFEVNSTLDTCTYPLIKGDCYGNKFAFGFYFNQYFEILFRAEAIVKEFTADGTISVYNFRLNYADTTEFVNCEFQIIPKWLLEATNVAYRCDLFYIQGQQYLPTDGGFEPSYQNGTCWGNVTLKLQQNLFDLMNMQCNSDNIPLCPPCEGGECDWSTLCELFPEMSSELQAELRQCIIDNSTDEEVYDILDSLDRFCDVVNEATVEELEVCIEPDYKGKFSTIRTLTTGNSTPNNSGTGGCAGAVGNLATGDDGYYTDRATSAERNHRMDRQSTASSFFNRQITAKFISDLGGTHKKRFVGVTGGYWNEVDGLYYNINDPINPINTGTLAGNRAVAFPDDYLIDLETGLGWCFSLTGTVSGITWGVISYANALTYAEGKSQTVNGNTYSDFRLPSAHEMMGIILFGGSSVANLMQEYAPFSATWGGTITNASTRWHTSTMLDASNNYYFSGGGAQKGEMRSHSSTGLFLICRNHFTF